MTTIFYESDFTLLETIKDIAGNEIDPRSINFVISYYTDGQNKYQASHKNGKYVNCDYDAGSGKLIVIFAKHGLRPGIMKHKLMVMSDDSLFPLGIRNDKSLAAIDITLSLTGGDAYTAEATMMVPALQITHSATLKDDIIDADEVNYLDSANNFSLVKTTWLNIIAKLRAVFNLEYEPKKATGENYVSDEELEVLQNTSGENTGDETAESIIDKIGTDGQIKSDYLPSLDYSTDIETDKLSTTKISAIKTFYDWAVGKFIDVSKLVTTWTATTLDANVPSEKLVKDSLNLKADITPANGSTSALRALYIASGYYKQTNTYYCVYNANTGYYEMNGLTDLTEAQMADIYINTAVQINIGIAASNISFMCMSYSNIRTSFPRTTMSGYDSTNDTNRFRGCDKLEVYKCYGYYGHVSYSCASMFSGCSELHTVDFLNLTLISNVAYVADCFTGCVKLVTANVKNLKFSFSFKDCPLLSLASLQYLVTNRANGTSRITITVHATVWGYLNDAVNYPTWNALLVDAVNNQYIDFASA